MAPKKAKMITVESATLEQLRYYAANTMNLAGAEQKTRETLVSALELLGVTEIEAEGLPAAAKAEAAPAVTPEADESDDYDLDEDALLEEPDPDELKRQQRIANARSIKEGEEFVVITIAKERTPGGQSKVGQEPVYVCHNGSAIFIPRGSPQVVKKKYADILGDAVTRVYSSIADEDGGGIDDGEDVPAYPVSFLGKAPKQSAAA